MAGLAALLVIVFVVVFVLAKHASEDQVLASTVSCRQPSVF